MRGPRSSGSYDKRCLNALNFKEWYFRAGTIFTSLLTLQNKGYHVYSFRRSPAISAVLLVYGFYLAQRSLNLVQKCAMQTGNQFPYECKRNARKVMENNLENNYTCLHT